jgi:hypothetical protein
MKNLSFLALLPLAGILTAPAAITDNLVAYWDFEGGTANNPAATGGTAFNGVLNGDATVNGTAKVGSGALNLDGTGDYLRINTNVNTTTSWTISAWFRSDIVPTTGRQFVYESTAAANGYAMSYGLRDGTVGNSNFQMFVDRTTGADVSQDFQVADGSVTAGDWFNIVEVYDDSQGTIVGYLNGVQRYTLNIGLTDTPVATTGLNIGTFRTANARFFDGSIDEVALWSRALAPAEAQQVFNRGSQGDNLTVLKYGVALSVTPTGGGTVSGSGIYDGGQEVSVIATPNPGYVFDAWDGSFDGQPASFTYIANADATATASFGEDPADPDGDDLSNFEEIVLYQTLPDNPDTDGDLIPDGAEVDINTSPTTSDTALVSFVRNNLSPNAAGAIALSPLRIDRNPGTGAISLFLSLSGSANQTTWQDIDLSSPDASIVPAGDGWNITFPAPSETVNSYILTGPRP